MTSVKKCAPTTILLNAIAPARNKKKYFSFGIKKIITKATTKIVEVCPDGKEWKSEFTLKKLNSKTLSKDAWFGLALPITCFNICVNKLAMVNERNK